LRRDGRVLEKAEVDLFKDKIVEMYAEGRLLKDIIAETGIAASTISDWRNKDTVFDASCIGAQNIGFELHADNLLTIPDEYEDVNKARLKSENIKWHLSKRASHRYGDRMVLDINNTIDLKGALVDAQQRLVKLAPSHSEQAIDVTPQLQPSTTDTESVAETDPDAISLEDILK